MKIVHISLYGPVTDGWNYQDNMIPKFQIQNGNEVTIIASKWVFNTEGTGVNPSASNYNDSTIITALETWGIPMAFMSLYPLIHKFKKYKSYIGSILVVVITLFLNPSEGFSLYAGAIIMLPTLEYMDSQEKELI